MFWFKKEHPTYRKWNIVDLFDYCYEKYNDLAQTNPETYGAKYDGPDPDDYSSDPAKQAEVSAFRQRYAIQSSGEWYWIDSSAKIVSGFRNLCFIWRTDLKEIHPTNYIYAKNYIDANRNDYVLSTGAFRQILRERYADFNFLTSFEYNYKTGKREYYDTMEEASVKFMDTLRVWKHDKQDAFTKLLFALRKDYDPVENYDKRSEIETEFKGSEVDKFTPSGKTKVELKQEGAELHTMERGAQTVTNSKTTYDSSNFNDTDKTSANTYTDKNVDKYGVDANGNVSDRKDTTTTSFENDRNDKTWKHYGYDENGNADARKNITIEHTHGNIGVTTSQQMIQSQFPIEYYDEIEHYAVNEFVHKYLVL